MDKKTPLTTKDIEHVAVLAKLHLSETEIEKFKGQLSQILEFVSKLTSVNTSKVLPTSQTTGLTNVLREDVIDESRILSQEDALSNAPDSHNGFFKIPAILE